MSEAIAIMEMFPAAKNVHISTSMKNRIKILVVIGNEL